MEETTTRVRLYVVRDFGQKLTATMDFLRENWKVLLKYLLYFLLPVSLVQALGLNGFMESYFAGLENITTGSDDEGVGMIISFLTSMLSYVGLAMVGSLLLEAVVYALMRMSDESETPLSQLQWSDLKGYFWQGIRRTLILSIVFIVLLIHVFAILALLVFLLGEIGAVVGIVVFTFFLLGVGIALAPFFAMVTPTYILQDDLHVMGAIKKAFRYGFGTWGGTWAVILVLSFLTNIVSSITMMPWYFAEIFKMVLGLDGSDYVPFVDSYIYSFLLYLLAVVQCFGNYVVSLILYVGCGYCYGHAAEKLDGMTMDSNISRFDKL
ncbi:MAG: hypothetical protein IJ527_09165 [Prevotella sp.]|nr:hypothetical protein [Prevotella sp.]